MIFLLLSVYKSPPGVFLCAMEWDDSYSTDLDKCDFLFLTHSKDAAVVHTATDSDKLKSNNKIPGCVDIFQSDI